MASHFLSIIFRFFAVIFVARCVLGDDVSFDQNYIPLWGSDHLTRLNNGRQVQLLLDQSYGGSGFRSKSSYGSGRIGIRMKVPDVNTAGIIASFFLTSAGEGQSLGNHDEIDFEFAGSTTVLQTNVFAGDSGGREEKYNLWFDPRKDFHSYEILWNQNIIVFYVDNTPIRIFKNNKNIGVNYMTQPMHVEASIWTGDWAGSIDWSQGPFVSIYENFGIDGCVTQDTSINPQCLSPDLVWNKVTQLDPQEQTLHDTFRKTNVVYDYCLDNSRPQNHPECTVPHT